jgi:hypothetical protein
MEGFNQYAPQTPPSDEDVPHQLRRQAAMKQPHQYFEEEEELEPDLAAYFSDFPHLDDTQIIAICRSFANYLVSLRPKKPRGPYQKRARTEGEEEK